MAKATASKKVLLTTKRKAQPSKCRLEEIKTETDRSFYEILQQECTLKAKEPIKSLGQRPLQVVRSISSACQKRAKTKEDSKALIKMLQQFDLIKD
jgi:hypothetical protein